jgi:hypothetical protein
VTDLRPLALALALVAAAGCASHGRGPATPRPAPAAAGAPEASAASAPRSILVVPPLNQTTAVDAPLLFNTTVTRPLAERGYYVFPVALTTGVLQDLGLTDEGLIARTPPSRFREVFGADAVLFVTIRAWVTTYLVLASSVSVEAHYRLVETASGALLWERTERVSQNSDVRRGWLETVLSAAVTAVAVDYRPLARQANERAFSPTAGLPAGPYRKQP